MLLSTTAVLLAQETTPKVEVFGGYSYANADNPQNVPNRVNLNGWNSSLAVNFNRTFGIVGDFSGHYGSADSSILAQCVNGGICSNSFKLTTKTHTFLLGPQVSFRAGRATPFAHALLGAAHTNISSLSSSDSSTGFATALGGGLDYNVTHRLGWRVQVDYLQTRFFSTTQNDFRLSTGPVFRFGGK